MASDDTPIPVATGGTITLGELRESLTGPQRLPSCRTCSNRPVLIVAGAGLRLYACRTDGCWAGPRMATDEQAAAEWRKVMGP